MSIPSLFGILALSAALAVVAQTGKAGSPPSASRTAASLSSASPDAELERDIRERFARSKISANNFTVRVRAGVATLEGRTDIVQHKGTATRLARTAGAKKVVNNIQISEQARQKAAEHLQAGRRRAQVKRSEAEHR